MTLLHMDGFDLGDLAVRSDIVSSGAGTSATTAFGYGMSQSLYGNNSYWAKNFTAASHIFTGCRVKNPSLGVSLSVLGDGGTTTHLVLAIAVNGSATLSRGGTTLTTAPVGTFGPYAGAWFYVEMEATIADSGGVCNVRVNGSSTAVMTFSGDTKNAGTNTTIDQVRWTENGSGDWNYFDDFYVANDSGSANNTFLGDVRVYTLAPNGNGNYSQFVGSDADSTNNYQLVDEQPYATADYVGSATSGNRDSYALTDLPANAATVFAVQEVAVVAKSDAGAQTIKQMMRVSSTDYETSAYTLGTSYAAIRNLREQNPNTSAAWTPSGVNGIEAGVRVG